MILTKTRNLLILTVVSLLMLSCKEDYIETVITTTPLTLSSEWQEIVPPRPLRCERTDQELLLHSATPYSKKVDPLAMLLQDGTVAKPQAQLFTADGKAHELDVLSFWGDEVVLSGRALPRSTNFTKLRIRSNNPIKLSEIRFNCYNYADVKR